MGHQLIHGLTSLLTVHAMLYVFAGALIGVFIGIIPGLSSAVVLSVVLAFVLHFDLVGTLCFFLGTHAGSYYSASTTSILLNTPAHPEAYAVALDGFPMARRGEAGRALGLSAASTCFGGLVGCGVLLGFIQIIDTLPGVFHPPEYLALIILAMLIAGTLGTDSIAKAVAAMGLGLAVASVGVSDITGESRFTFHQVGLLNGLSLSSVALGVFAVAQMVLIFGAGTTVSPQDMTGQDVGMVEAVKLERGLMRQILGGIAEAFRHFRTMLQGGLTGALTGIVPGIGGFAANFISYGLARMTSRRKWEFGTGIPEGVIAPEASSLAKEAGSMIPIIGLGIPGSVGGALFIAALTIKGIHTGWGFAHVYPTITYQIVWVIALSGLIGTVAGVVAGPLLARITNVPGPLIVPFIFVLCVVGAYVSDAIFFSDYEVIVFGAIGFALIRLRFPVATFALGIVLGKTFEDNLYLTRNIYGWSWLEKRTLADVLFALCILVLIVKAFEIRAEKRRRREQRDAELAETDDQAIREEIVRRQRLRTIPYPLLAPIVSFALLAGSIWFTVYALENLKLASYMMPVFGGIAIAVPMVFLFPMDVYRYVVYRRLRRQTETLPLREQEAEEIAVIEAEAREAELVPALSPFAVLMANEAMPTDAQALAVGEPLPKGRKITLKAWGWHGQYSREIAGIGWLASLILLCWLVGFIWGVPVFMVAYGLTATGRFFGTWLGRGIYAAASAAVMWGATWEMLNVLHFTFGGKLNL